MNKKKALSRLMPFQMAFLGSACLYVAADLEIADRLIKGPKSSEQLAREAGADVEKLYRVPRFLASEGIFEERPGRQFALNETAELLRTDVEQSFQPFVLMNTPRAFEAALELLPAVKSGEIPFVRRFGQHPFDMMLADPESAARLERGWQGVHGPETDAFLDAFDFTGIDKFADIGGGHGDVVVGFLKRHPDKRAAIFDMGSVAGTVGKRLEAAGLSNRCEVVAGDFFKEIPVQADAYFLRHILHDWDDQECRTILGHIAARCQAGSRVLIAECVIKEPNVPDAGKLLDMEMLMFLSGKERTEDEYRELLEASGFDFIGVTPTDSIISVVEGRYRG